MTTDTDIKIPENHYVGFQIRGTRENRKGIPLGFMTPDGADSGAKSRKATVDRWSSSSIPSKSIENKPMLGFKLGENVKHSGGWGKGSVCWRIEDPRGFELEISSPNLAQILGLCTIENGEILEKCVWGRLHSENVLIPVCSDIYKNAVENTERVKKNVSLKEVKAGYKVLLQNGTECIYLGYMYLVKNHKLENSICGLMSKKKHVVVNTGTKKDKLITATTLKIAEIKDSSKELTDLEVEDFINTRLCNKSIDIDEYHIVGVTHHKESFNNIVRTITTVKIDELSKTIDKNLDNFAYYYVIFKDIDTGTYSVASSYDLFHRHSLCNYVTFSIIDYNKLLNDNDLKYITMIDTRYRHSYSCNKTIDIDLMKTDKYESYLISYAFKTKVGSEVTIAF